MVVRRLIICAEIALILTLSFLHVRTTNQAVFVKHKHRIFRLPVFCLCTISIGSLVAYSDCQSTTHVAINIMFFFSDRGSTETT